jgi:hypothetical protein
MLQTQFSGESRPVITCSLVEAQDTTETLHPPPAHICMFVCSLMEAQVTTESLPPPSTTVGDSRPLAPTRLHWLRPKILLRRCPLPPPLHSPHKPCKQWALSHRLVCWRYYPPFPRPLSLSRRSFLCLAILFHFQCSGLLVCP